AVDQPETGTTQRVAAAADGESGRPRPGAHARSTVMHAMQLVMVAVVGIQQPVVPVPPVLVRPPVVAQLDGLQALQGLDALAGLEGLAALEGVERVHGRAA